MTLKHIVVWRAVCAMRADSGAYGHLTDQIDAKILQLSDQKFRVHVDSLAAPHDRGLNTSHTLVKLCMPSQIFRSRWSATS